MAIKDIVLDGKAMPVREFDLNWMCINPSICMIAKRGSGKSWIVRSILKHFSNIPVGAIIAPTDRLNSFYGHFFPEVYIHYEFNASLIERILDRQLAMIQKAKDKAKKGKKVDPRAFLIMDDCLSSKLTWMKDQTISRVFFDGRHYHLMYILTMQFPLGITPELRCNFDYIFLLAEDFVSNLKRLYDHYAGMFQSFDVFRYVFTDITSDFGAMVIVNRGSRRDFLEKVFWYKAGKGKPKTMGCKQFNDFNKHNLKQDWNIPKKKQFDINDYVQKNKKYKTVPEVKKITKKNSSES